MTPDQQQALDATIVKLSALLRDAMTWAKLKPQYVRLYLDTFDQAEVDGLLAIYATPAGKAMIEKMPVVLQKSVAIGQAQMQALMPRIMAIVQESMKASKPAK